MALFCYWCLKNKNSLYLRLCLLRCPQIYIYSLLRGREGEMYVCHTNQIGSPCTINSQSNFLFLLYVNVTRCFCLLVSNGNLTLLFFTRKVAIKTDKSVTLIHTVRINKQEANLTIRPEKCLSYLNIFSSILISYLAFLKNGNFSRHFLKGLW